MQNEKNKLFDQTDSQRSPGLAKPEDFTVNPPDTNKDYPFHGQRGDSKTECDALLKVREVGRPKHDKTNYESRIQKELARENAGTKQRGGKMTDFSYTYNGAPLTPEFKDGMWTVGIDGVNFCSATKEGLIPAIKSIFVLHVVGK